METEPITIDKPVSSIVMFGPPTKTDGFRAATYYQCVIDPNMCSPSGDYIRFDQTFQKTELHGWQRVEGLTVCELLEDAPELIAADFPRGYTKIEGAKVTMRSIARGE